MKGISILNQYKGICNYIIGKLTTKLNKVQIIPNGNTSFIWSSQKVLIFFNKDATASPLKNDFDWLEFNLTLTDRVLSACCKTIVIDPSFISK